MKLFTLFSVLVICMSTLVGCGCSTIEPGTVGIGVDTSGVQDGLYHEGLHTVGPLTDIVVMSLRTQTYEMAGEESIHALTRDQLSVDLEVTVSFHLQEAAAIQVYRAYSPNYADAVVHPIVRTAVRDAASQFTAVALVDERERLQTQMETLVNEQLRTTLEQRGLSTDSIVVENVMLRNIDLPQSLDESIAAVQRQHQETQQRIQALETARAESERQRTQAEGEAAALLIAAQAEADANRIRSQSLTPQLLELRRIEAMQALSTSPTSRLIMLPVGANPLIQLPGD